MFSPQYDGSHSGPSDLQTPPTPSRPDLVASHVAVCTSSGKKKKKKKRKGEKTTTFPDPIPARNVASGTVGSPCRGKAELLPGHMVHRGDGGRGGV